MARARSLLAAMSQLGNSPSAVTLGDLNGDGVLDLVAAYRADNKVGVLLGKGDGTFKQQVAYQVGAAPSAVVVADFNGDGKRDVAVANFKDSKVSVLFGNGDGTLQTAVHYPVGVGPESLVAIDPNNSGHADLVSANGNGGLSPKGSDVTVLRNLTGDTGSATSTTTITRTIGSGPVTYGAEVLLQATVTGDGNSGTPTGTVAFTANGNSFDPQCNSVGLTQVADNVSTATCDTRLLPVTPGTDTVVNAAYSGDFTYMPSDSTKAPLDQEVDPATPVFNPGSLLPYTIMYGTSSTTITGQICQAFSCVPAHGGAGDDYRYGTFQRSRRRLTTTWGSSVSATLPA